MYDYHHEKHEKKQLASKKSLWVTLILTSFFTLVEIVGGLLSNSLALLSDSAHMISDVFALSLSMTAIYLSTRPPNAKFTFGYLRFEIIASFINGLALGVIAIGILIEGIRRFLNPQEIDLPLMLSIASIGLVVNIVLTYVLSRSMKEENNLNVQSALWHFIGDLINSIGVIVAGVLIYFSGWVFLDPLISIIIAGIIFIGGFRIIKESFKILMESVPDKFNLDEIRQDIAQVEGVEDVHEMHLWSISSDHYSITAHVFADDKVQPYCIVLSINEMLKEKYDITHSTIQIEHVNIHPHGEYGRQFINNRKLKAKRNLKSRPNNS